MIKWLQSNIIRNSTFNCNNLGPTTRSKNKRSKRTRTQFESTNTILISDGDDDDDVQAMYQFKLNGKSHAMPFNVIQQGIINRIKEATTLGIDKVMALMHIIATRRNIKQDENIGIIALNREGDKNYNDKGQYCQWRDVKGKRIIICILHIISHYSVCIMDAGNYYYLPGYDKLSNALANESSAGIYFVEFLNYALKNGIIKERPRNRNMHIILPKYKTFHGSNC